MTNAEIIKALRNCEVHGNGGDCRKECPYVDQDCGACMHEVLIHDAADALEAADKRVAELESWAIHLLKQLPKEGEWIMDENPHDGDCRCSACLIAIDAMHERNHELLNALTGGKWWTFYRYCPKCGAKMDGERKDNETKLKGE